MNARVTTKYNELRDKLTLIISHSFNRNVILTQKDYLFFLQQFAEVQVDIEDIKKELNKITGR